MVNYFLDILYQFIIINDHLHFSSYFRQSKILSDISGRRTLRGPTPVGVPLDLSTPTGISCIGTYGENCKSDNVSKYRVLSVAFLLIWHEINVTEKYSKFIINYLFYFLFAEN